jgi:hypothetical protein
MITNDVTVAAVLGSVNGTGQYLRLRAAGAWVVEVTGRAGRYVVRWEGYARGQHRYGFTPLSDLGATWEFLPARVCRRVRLVESGAGAPVAVTTPPAAAPAVVAFGPGLGAAAAQAAALVAGNGAGAPAGDPVGPDAPAAPADPESLAYWTALGWGVGALVRWVDDDARGVVTAFRLGAARAVPLAEYRWEDGSEGSSYLPDDVPDTLALVEPAPAPAPAPASAPAPADLAPAPATWETDSVSHVANPPAPTPEPAPAPAPQGASGPALDADGELSAADLLARLAERAEARLHPDAQRVRVKARADMRWVDYDVDQRSGRGSAISRQLRALGWVLKSESVYLAVMGQDDPRFRATLEILDGISSWAPAPGLPGRGRADIGHIDPRDSEKAIRTAVGTYSAEADRLRAAVADAVAEGQRRVDAGIGANEAPCSPDESAEWARRHVEDALRRLRVHVEQGERGLVGLGVERSALRAASAAAEYAQARRGTAAAMLASYRAARAALAQSADATLAAVGADADAPLGVLADAAADAGAAAESAALRADWDLPGAE